MVEWRSKHESRRKFIDLSLKISSIYKVILNSLDNFYYMFYILDMLPKTIHISLLHQGAMILEGQEEKNLHLKQFFLFILTNNCFLHQNFDSNYHLPEIIWTLTKSCWYYTQQREEVHNPWRLIEELFNIRWQKSENYICSSLYW